MTGWTNQTTRQVKVVAGSIAGLGVVLVIAGQACGKSAEEREQERKRAEADEYNRLHANDRPAAPAIDAAPAAPIERAPTFEPGKSLEDKPREIELANLAAHAVYDVCSEYYAFREGSTLTSTFVPPMGKRTTSLANVSVKLFDPAKADGNTLWYQVDFTRDGKLATLAARKAISGRMCHLPEDESPVPFNHKQ